VTIGILFLDPAIVGASFVGAIILMERSQNTLVALAVSPATPPDYLLSKIITLTLLTFAVGMSLVCIAYWPISVARVIRFSIALSFTGALAVTGGVLLVAQANTMNHFIARAFPVSVLLFMPFLAHFRVLTGAWAWILFGLNPGHPPCSGRCSGQPILATSRWPTPCTPSSTWGCLLPPSIGGRCGST
jgi:fluoroquinolone transport system permease protein